VEVGGGVRDVDTAHTLLDAGASFVVLGSVAVRDPETALAICDVAQGRVLLGLDVRDGIARVQGWTEAGKSASEVLQSWRDWHASGVIYTDTTRDGVLAGPDLDGLRWCREGYSGPVYLSGGVSSLDDITACAAAGAAGVVIGKALYEGRIDLEAALRAVGSAVS
jgi:phosphoribosylformimino-5-aminoimidazole carboxamide ribotide isomerase